MVVEIIHKSPSNNVPNVCVCMLVGGGGRTSQTDYYMSRVANQHHCFHYIECTIPLLPDSENSSL